MYQAIVSGDERAANRMAVLVTVLAVILLLLADRFQRRAIGQDRTRLLP